MCVMFAFLRLCHVRDVLQAKPSQPTSCSDGAGVRAIHVAIGDGLPTDGAACKMLFALLREQAPAHNYNMLVVR